VNAADQRDMRLEYRSAAVSRYGVDLLLQLLSKSTCANAMLQCLTAAMKTLRA